MYRRLFNFVILITLILIPNQVLADTIKIEDINIYDNNYEYYKISGGVLSHNDANNNNYNIRLDKINKKLYLKDFATTKKIETDIDGLNIVLEGENQVISDDNAIYSNKNIIFSGNGSILIEGESNGIKSEQKVTINSGTYDINGITYNGIEALAIEINDGIVKTRGGYSGIHTQSHHDPFSPNQYFHVNGGNLFTTAAKSTAINSHSTKYNNCIIVTKDDTGISLDLYGNATLLEDASITKKLKIEKDQVLTIKEGVTLQLSNKNLLELEGAILMNGYMLAENSRYYNIYIKEYENGQITTESNIVLEGEEVKLEVFPNEGYEIKDLKTVNTILDIKANVLDNKFIMPSADITIEALFEKKEQTKEQDKEQNKTTEIENPKTGDNITTIFIILGLSMVSIIAIILFLIKNKKINI